MRGRILGPLAASVALSVLAACSSGSPPGGGTAATSATATTAAPTPVTSTAAGATSYGAYAFVQPAGWTVDAGRQKNGITTYLKAPQPVSGVVPTFTVVATTPSAVPSLDDLVQQGTITFRQRGATVTAIAERTIGGEPAKGYVVTSSTPRTGTTGTQALSQTQYYVVHGASVYVLTMTSAPAAAKDLQATGDSILSTWSWTTA